MAEVLPNFNIGINNLCVKVGFTKKDLALQLSLGEVFGVDYFRDEDFKVSVPYVAEKVKAVGFDDDGKVKLKKADSNVADSANFYSPSVKDSKSTISGVSASR